MIYITGDTHGSIDIRKLNVKNFPDQKSLTKSDYVIIVGDFGVIWDNSNEQEFWLKWLDSKNFTTLFIDGNHENFDLLNAYPVTSWNGGKVHEIRPSVLHLMRGQVFMIDGIKFFTFGGAQSIDKLSRKEFVSWWPQEIPNWAEVDEGLTNLEQHNNEVDVVLTHTAPTFYVSRLADYKIYDPICKILDNFAQLIRFKQWYFGHMHVDRVLDDRFTAVYNSVLPGLNTPGMKEKIIKGLNTPLNECVEDDQ